MKMAVVCSILKLILFAIIVECIFYHYDNTFVDFVHLLIFYIELWLLFYEELDT